MKIAQHHCASIASMVLLLLISTIVGAGQIEPPAIEIELTPDIKAALDTIDPESMRRNLDFIASDELGGRDTPSPGLDMAAEYIAKQFKAAGLLPMEDGTYFQEAHWQTLRPEEDSFVLHLMQGGETIHVALAQTSVNLGGAVDVTSATLFKIDADDAETLAQLIPEQVSGKVVLTVVPDYRTVERARRREVFMARRAFMRRMAELNASLVVSVNRHIPTGEGFGRPMLIDPDNPYPRTGQNSGVPQITVHHPAFATLLDEAAPGDLVETLTFKVGGPREHPVVLRNVIGLLRGSDPTLRETYVMVTAHYDHIGIRHGTPEGEDNINNGANDDGSGTVSVIELAKALCTLETKPKRSIIFMCVFGEERGLLGSRYYGRNPIFPILQTVADVNLEHMGRTDDVEGPQIRRASMTGFDYSEVGEIFRVAGELTGIVLFKHETNSDAFFSRSDNQALADQGVPAHTISVAYIFPDYHGVGDHADLVDYENLALVNQMVGLGILHIANSEDEPRWSESNSRASSYLDAWRQRRGIEVDGD
ncbi:MAG: M28 family peptidase [Planctomycetota bacterium]|nr:M28 family peptidase [Planctomycetota bacterium]